MNLPRLFKTSISERAKNERIMSIEMAVDKGKVGSYVGNAHYI